MNTWGSGQAAKYLNTFSYDANGNITNQERRNENGALIDNLTYGYNKVNGKTVQNCLYHVDDTQATTAAFTDDIDDMGSLTLGQTINTANNYQYDQEGRLIRDDQEGIAEIKWRVDGKVKKINRTAGSVKKNLIFEYEKKRKLLKEERFSEKKSSAGEMGHRIAKHVLTSANVLEKSTFYVLDAQGNAMAVYERAVNASNQSITFEHTEKHIFGSSRLGVMNVKVPMLGSQNVSYSMINKKHRIGERNYELSNHLGSVVSVVTDCPIPHSSNGTTHDYYQAQLLSSQDYSAFGVQLSGRNFVKVGAKEGRFGFQGQEEDDELKGEGNSLNYKYRMHDPRLGRFFAIDPLASKYPYNSPYAFSENVVINCVELEGLEKRAAIFGEASDVGTGKLIIVNDKDNYNNLKDNVTISGYDILYIERWGENDPDMGYSLDMERYKTYVSEYCIEHNMQLDILVILAHGNSEGIGVTVIPEIGDGKSRDRFNGDEIKQYKEGTLAKKNLGIAIGDFLGTISNLNENGVLVLASCNLGQDLSFGEEIRNGTGENITVYTNGDKTSIMPNQIINFELTTKCNLNNGWIKSDSTGTTELKTSIKLMTNGAIENCEGSENCGTQSTNQ